MPAASDRRVAPTATPGQGVDTAAFGAATAEAATRQALDRMDRSYRDLQSNVEGQASMNALLALVDSLGALPGRKTVVYFCEGLTVAPAVEAKFRSIIATANRKNVSVYALDAAGLRAHSEQTETARELTDLSTSAVPGVERSDNRKWTEDLEVNEQMLKSDPSAALGHPHGPDRRLADSEHQRSRQRHRPDQRRPAQLLRADLHADQPGARRHLPEDRGEGEAAWRGRAVAERVSGRARQRGVAGPHLRGARRWRPSRRRHGPARLPCSRARSACRCPTGRVSPPSSPRSPATP